MFHRSHLEVRTVGLSCTRFRVPGTLFTKNYYLTAAVFRNEKMFTLHWQRTFTTRREKGSLLCTSVKDCPSRTLVLCKVVCRGQVECRL